MKKLWHSFVKELTLSSRTFYFYIEIIMAAIMIFLLLFVIPENFSSTETEYLYLDMPEAAQEFFIDDLYKNEEDLVKEVVEFGVDDEVVMVDLYSNEDKEFYIFSDQDAMVTLAEKDQKFGGAIHVSDTGEITYTYYLQGYETERLRNIFLVLHNEEDIQFLGDHAEAQEVRSLNDDFVGLSDRENMLPAFLTFNGSLMGLFIIASYIFLDKKEGVIKAFAVTPSSVATYLLSKIGMLMFTSTITSFLIVILVMGFNFNAGLMFILLVTSGFAASVLGILLTSYFEDIMQSFAALFVLIIVFMLPNIAYFIPGWNPTWVKWIPSYFMQEGFKEVLLPNPDASFVLLSSLGFLVGGIVLFLFANWRFKKTISV